MPNAKPDILLAEDDPNLGLLLLDYLEAEGFTVTLCADGESALHAFRSCPFDLCLLDVMMPKLDGFALARHIRAKNRRIPILFISAKSLKEDKWKGYGLGADDYVTKPFDEEELLWKIKVLIRRTAQIQMDELSLTVTLGKYTFDVENQSLMINGKSRRITEKESRILDYLSANRNRVIKREDMLKTLWGENDYFLGRSLDVFISKIRKYLGEDPELAIENVFGVGFIFKVPETPASPIG